jgi:phytanoyl-CoA hydroxylase
MKFTEAEANQMKADFDRDGYVALRGFLSPDKLELLLQNIDRYVDEVAPTLPRTEIFYEDKENESTLKQMVRMSNYDEFFREMIEESEFREVADILMGRRSIPQNMQYFNKPPKVGKATPPTRTATIG